MTAVVTGQACRLYRFYVRDPRTNYTTKTLGYVGETARVPFQRLMEHVQEQPWADTIVSWEVDDRVFPDKAAVLAAEAAAIHAERPLYNIEENRGNPNRIPPWRAQQQRQARDRQAGVAGSSARPGGSARPPAQPRRRTRPPARSPQRQPEPVADVELPAFLVRGALAVAMWLLLAGALWWAGGEEPRSSGVAAGVVVGGVLLFGRRRKRRKRGRRR